MTVGAAETHLVEKPQPFVLTVVIPTHNRPVLLRRAVDSVLADLPLGAEVLVIDDASEIPAEEVLSDLVSQDGRLRVLRNAGARGAAGARNFGVDQAQGEIILFLDDDDELLANYVARVLQISAQNSAEYGYCATLRCDPSGHEIKLRLRHGCGQIPSNAPLRHKIAALSAGFWIKRMRFKAVGGLDPAQKVDEDTSLCCSLVASGSLPWYEDDPGVRVHSFHTAADASGAQLTQATRDDVVLDCYLRTWTSHEQSFPPWSEARWFLGARYLRRAAKLGHRARILRFISFVRPRTMALAFAAYGAGKLLSAKLKRAS